MSYEIFFLGLGPVGTSIALAFSESDSDVKLVGHDPMRERSRRAKDLGAFNRVVSNPRAASKSADIVILDVPSVDVQEYLEMLQQTLKPRGIVIDTTLVRSKALQWAEAILAPDRDYIGATPIIGPKALLAENGEMHEPRADMFQNGLMALTVPASSSPKAIATGLDLAEALGASPFFIDADEHDGITASVEWIPRLIGAALLQESSKAQNWEDIQRVAGATFATITHLCSAHPAEILGPTLTLNREILLAKLNGLMNELHNLREVLADESGKSLMEYINAASAARDRWFSARHGGAWAARAMSAESTPARGSKLGKMLSVQPRPPRELR